MALAARTIHIPAGVGIDEGTRPELIEFGSRSLVNVNVRQNKRGTLDTRLGFSALSNGLIDASTATVGYRMFADRDSIVRITSAPQAEVYSPQAGAWQNLGRVPEAACRLIDLPSVGVTTYLEDVDATNGYIAVSWLAQTAVTTADGYLAVIDQASGSIVRAPEKVGTSTNVGPPLLAVENNYFIMVRFNDTGTKYEAFYLDTTSRATVNAGWVAFGASLATDGVAGTTTMVLHSIPTGAGSARVAMFYQNSSGGTDRATVKTFNVAGGVLETKTINTASVTPSHLALGGTPTDTLWVTWNQTVSIRVTGLSPFAITAAALASTSTIMTMTNGCTYLGICASSAAGKARVWAGDTIVFQGAMRGLQTTLGAAATDGSQISVPATGMTRKPFLYGGRHYSLFFASDAFNVQQTLVVCDWTDDVTFLRPVANPEPGLSSGGLLGLGKFVAGLTSSKLFMGLSVTRSGVAQGTAYAELDFASTARWQSAAFGNSTYLSGGLAAYFDGTRMAEMGFLFRPSTPATGLSAAGITGTFRYICVYEEVDADGNWHQSGLSTPSASVVPANQKVTVSTVPLTITSRLSSAAASARAVRVAFYRTLTGGLAPYYRLGTTINDTSAATVSFADTTTDTTLASNSKLYAQPGVSGTSQDKRPPPPFSTVVAYNGMLVGAVGSDVWYSGQNVSGEGVWFNPIFQVPVPGDGDIIALAVMDGTLFAFKRREVWALAGEAPSDNGAQGGLGQPRRLAVDVGCIDARSTCVTALGVFFQSDRGIEILTRAQTVEWIGEPVQDTVTSFPICTSATVDPGSCTLILEMASSQAGGLVTGTGRALIYDLSLKVWVSTDRRTSSAGAVDGPSQSGCIVRSGSAYRYAWMNANGQVEVEYDTVLDGGGAYWIGTQWESAWAKLGLQQEQMLWGATLLFQRRDAAGLKVEIAYDYQAYSAANDKLWTEAETLGQVQLELRPKPKGQAMKFRVSGIQPAVLGTGQGISFIGLSLDIAPKQGPTKGTPRLDPALRK